MYNAVFSPIISSSTPYHIGINAPFIKHSRTIKRGVIGWDVFVCFICSCCKKTVLLPPITWQRFL